MEDLLDEVESENNDLQAKLTEAQKSTDEAGQAKKILENRGKMDYSKIDRLENELAEYTARNEEVSEKFDQVQKEIEEHEELLDIQEERLENAELRVKELESEVTQVGNTLRSMKINDEQASDRTLSGDTKIEEWKIKLQEEDERAQMLEERDRELQEQQDVLDEELAEVKNQHEKTKREFDAVLAEIAEM